MIKGKEGACSRGRFAAALSCLFGHWASDGWHIRSYTCISAWERLARTISKRQPAFPVTSAVCRTALTTYFIVMSRARRVEPVILAERI